MLSDIKIKVGSKNKEKILPLQLTPVTIFVGPNNSGKSLILSEITNACNESRSLNHTKILKEINFISYDNIAIQNIIKGNETFKPDNQATEPGQVVIGNSFEHNYINEVDYRIWLKEPNNHKHQFIFSYARYNYKKIDSSARSNLVSSQPHENLIKPRRSLQILFKDNDKRKHIQNIIFHALGKYLFINPYTNGSLELRLAYSIPPNDDEDQPNLRLDDKLIEYINNQSFAVNSPMASDGIKSFLGILIEVFTGNPELLTIDEPEAFLSSSLSHTLGKEIPQLLAKQNKRLFVSTHSAHFLKGIIDSGEETNIVRLTYLNDESTARILSSEKISALYKDPLLRSTNVLDALFYDHVIIVEGSKDQAFYDEINHRLVTFRDSRGISNCLIINTNGKSAIHRVLKPLRELGIPTAAIVDVDVIKEGGAVWTGWLNALNIPEPNHQGFANDRLAIDNARKTLPSDFKTHGGVECFNASIKEAANNLFDRLAEYGLFVVRNGELESWLKHLEVNTKKEERWLFDIFDKMGKVGSPEYVQPSKGDVWDFIGQVKNWLQNSARKGIPE